METGSASGSASSGSAVAAQPSTTTVSRSASLTRLYIKQSSLNATVLAKLEKKCELPDAIRKLVKILNQFDQLNFAVLWFSTNMIMFFDEFCAKADKPGEELAVRTFDPVPADDNEAFLKTYNGWIVTFQNGNELSQANVQDMLGSERTTHQLSLFMQAFQAVWNRDYPQQPLEIDAAGILNHLFTLFNHYHRFHRFGKDESQPEIIALESYTIARHVLITFTHMASKAYELITRNLK